MKRFAIVKLIVSLVIPQVAGLLGAIATTPRIGTWYAGLVKPDFNPPNWLFGPAWTTLFVLMGIALFLVWNQGWSEPKVRLAMIVFLVQLGLNILWSWLFFGMRSPKAGFVEIIVLWVAILGTVILFFRVSKLAGWFLIPYIGWVSFAAVLNAAVMVLNR